MQIKLRDIKDRELWKVVRDAEKILAESGSTKLTKWFSTGARADAVLKVLSDELGVSYLVTFIKDKLSGGVKVEVNTQNAKRVYKLHGEKIDSIIDKIEHWVDIKTDPHKKDDFLVMTGRVALIAAVEQRLKRLYWLTRDRG